MGIDLRLIYSPFIGSPRHLPYNLSARKVRIDPGAIFIVKAGILIRALHPGTARVIVFN
jgi:hypothetical protein